jgi:hypothetical protein
MWSVNLTIAFVTNTFVTNVIVSSRSVEPSAWSTS